jgi:uncharacterized membrane protein YeaQ/YmgE (transglycosylase-associated protein family)
MRSFSRDPETGRIRRFPVVDFEDVHAPRPTTTAILLGLVGAVVASALNYGWLALFSERFEQGATLSGLNQDGGGPGFLLLITAGVLGLMTRSRYSRSLGTLGALAESCFFGALAGAGLFLFLTVRPLGAIEAEPIVSGVIAAFIAARFSATIVEAAWRASEQGVSVRA